MGVFPVLFLTRFVLHCTKTKLRLELQEFCPNDGGAALYYCLLVVLERLSTIFAVIRTVSGWFKNFAFPPHTSPAYSSFSTNTLIVPGNAHLILVPRCGSVMIASILPTCVLPFPVLLLLCVHPKGSILVYLRQGTYI